MNDSSFIWGRKKEPKYHIDNCSCLPEQKKDISKCTCLEKDKSKYSVYMCIEEYNKCPKILNGINFHGHYKVCKLCAKLICHYHCTNCNKIIPNDNCITSRIVLHQGKHCKDYVK